ncbi:MAG: protein-L-isoaspartate(D-aspartate) O-methyltransferase [Phycisphaerae bacterium]|nr:protein-L-isoaspartate(D-aspartate) O-methyltransferase [Phycisphaerae bacterium]
MNQLTESTALDRMIQEQLVDRGINDQRVLEIMRRIPRARFFTPAQREDVFADRASPIGYEQTISQPYIVALMTEKLRLTGSERVLEIGTGSGYQTALLSRLAKEVFTIERIKPLLDEAFHRLMDLECRNVHFRLGDGSVGWRNSDGTPMQFDRILIAAGLPAVPDRLLKDQLVDGGLAVLPVGPQNEQSLLVVERRGNHLKNATISGCRFVPLIGEAGWPDAANKVQ